MRLIDADKLAKPIWAEDGASPDKRDGYNLGLYKMWQEIQNAPTELGPVIAYWDDCYKCSNCGNIPYTDCDSNPAAFGYKYCPYCGATMKEE